MGVLGILVLLSLLARLPGNSPAQPLEPPPGGSVASLPRHLMLFPAGGRRAEKSETPPSTSASRPRGQSTKGGGRRERGRSCRAKAPGPGRDSFSLTGDTLHTLDKDPQESRHYPWQPHLTLDWCHGQPPRTYFGTQGRLGPSNAAMVRRRRPQGPTPPA